MSDDFAKLKVGDKVTIFPAWAGNNLEIVTAKTVGKKFATLSDGTKINLSSGWIVGQGNGYSMRMVRLTVPAHYEAIEKHEMVAWLDNLPHKSLSIAVLRAMKAAYDSAIASERKEDE